MATQRTCSGSLSYRRKVLIVGAVLGLAVTGCSASSESSDSSSSTDPLPQATPPTLTWGPCADGSAGAADVSAFRCSSAAVPLDYADPTAKSLQLAAIQHPATDPANRVGTLFFNPGGPGGEGTVQFPQWIGAFPEELKARFDIVSWDPRGIGASTAVQCFDSEDAEGELLGSVDAFPADAADQKAFIDVYSQVGKKCADRAGELLEYVSTADTARDLDLLRQAVGDDKTTYWGVSYGTFLGATYANLFPDHVRALVLDGNIDPLAWTANGDSAPDKSINLRIGSAAAANESVEAFLKYCGETSTELCEFSAGSAEATAAKWTTLLERLRAQPVTIGTGDAEQSITYPSLVSQIDNAMDLAFTAGGITGWPAAAASLQKLWIASEQPAAPAPPPAPAPAPADQSYTGPEQSWAVMCGDAPSPPASAWPGLADDAAKVASDSGANLVWSDVVCAGWTTRAKLPYAGPWDAKTEPTILVVNNTHDPSTPYANGEAMVKRLDNAQLLKVEGYGHTALLNPSACAYTAITKYLLDGTTLPAKDAVCAQDRKPFEK
ncbi:alpha/beta hydrolase [Antrihabitans spumae]|uniref:Alpha/beta hydrolase n=1 Tax=Antrihabitans spumae TaxID=3373370 RepID=A0ABW7KCH5_9NOCA